MTPEFKPIAQALLQARLEGRLTCGTEFMSIVQKFDLTGIMMQEVTDFVTELRFCDQLHHAQAIAAMISI